MDVLVSTELRFYRTPDGAYWTTTIHPYHFWLRYLTVFDRVRILARARAVDTIPDQGQRVDGPGVGFVAVPHYLGPQQYLRSMRAVQKTVRAAFTPGMGVIFRVVSPIAAALTPTLDRLSYPYGVEVLGDPYDLFAPGVISHPLRPFFRWWSSRQLRRQCARACAALYVTERYLQRRYPCPDYSVGASDGALGAADFVEQPRPSQGRARACSLVAIGSLAQPYKGFDTLLEALASPTCRDLDLSLRIIGDGRYRKSLEDHARALGVSARVRFEGQVASGEPVMALLDAAQLFVLPSRTEGLPRALVEAMARGLPCIGSDVGGIPELLPDSDLVFPGDPVSLANKIREIVTDPVRMAAMSARNLAKAREFHQDILHVRRVAFFGRVRDATERWLAGQGRTPGYAPGP